MLIPKIALLLLAASLPAPAQKPTLDAPDRAPIGTRIQVQWSGPGEDYDVIYLVKTGADDAAKPISSSAILQGINPVGLTMPEEAGNYELRYRHKTEIIARRSITISAATRSLKAPATAKAGSEVEVKWQGPGNDHDSIGLFPARSADNARSLTHAEIVQQRNPIVLRMPEQSDEYELRYTSRNTRRILARRPLTVIGGEASPVVSPPAPSTPRQ